MIPSPKLKNFSFIEKIGSGSYATVYKAHKKNDEKDIVAIKCISKSSLNSVSKDNLLIEIELLKTLTHPHIISLKDFLWDESYVYILMEYCGGGDLHSYLRCKRQIPENVSRRFFQQLVTALHYMRLKKVNHMDIKPSNILLTSDKSPILKIGDFGFAHYVEGDTQALYLKGSLLYMAPEIVTSRSYNEKADLWSVGVVLFECLYGYPPFISNSNLELENKIKCKDPINIPLKKDMSENCRNLLIALLKRDPAKRISYQEFFDHPFVDLEHIPSELSLCKAKELVEIAVAFDENLNFQEAFNFYCQAIAHFIPAISYEQQSHRKEVLRLKVTQYMERAEQLKMKYLNKSSVKESAAADYSDKSSNNIFSPLQKLLQLSEENQQLKSALLIIKSAEVKEEMENYESAFERYKAGLALIIEILAEPNSLPYKDLLQSQVSIWMSKAECIKEFIELQNAQHLNDVSAQNITDSQGRCLIQ